METVQDLLPELGVTQDVLDQLIIWNPGRRQLFSWRINPPKRPQRADPLYQEKILTYEEEIYIDSLCRGICHLPSIKGLHAICPDVEGIDIYASYLENKDTAGEYTPHDEVVDIVWPHPYSTTASLTDNKKSLTHEIRHGYQDLTNCFQFRSNPELADNFLFTLAFNRVIEDDANVFSIVLAYEIMIVDSDPCLLQKMLSGNRRTSVQAYLDAIDKDPEAHWNGRAANAAFKAYLAKGNQSVLDKYDMDTCEGFLEDGVPHNTGSDSSAQKQKLFEGHIAPLRRMPYVDEHGELKERPLYMKGVSVKPENLVRNLSAEVNYWLMQARMRDLSPA